MMHASYPTSALAMDEPTDKLRAGIEPRTLDGFSWRVAATLARGLGSRGTVLDARLHNERIALVAAMAASDRPVLIVAAKKQFPHWLACIRAVFTLPGPPLCTYRCSRNVDTVQLFCAMHTRGIVLAPHNVAWKMDFVSPIDHFGLILVDDITALREHTLLGRAWGAPSFATRKLGIVSRVAKLTRWHLALVDGVGVDNARLAYDRNVLTIREQFTADPDILPITVPLCPDPTTMLATDLYYAIAAGGTPPRNPRQQDIGGCGGCVGGGGCGGCVGGGGCGGGGCGGGGCGGGGCGGGGCGVGDTLRISNKTLKQQCIQVFHDLQRKRFATLDPHCLHDQQPEKYLLLANAAFDEAARLEPDPTKRAAVLVSVRAQLPHVTPQFVRDSSAVIEGLSPLECAMLRYIAGLMLMRSMTAELARTESPTDIRQSIIRLQQYCR